MENNKELYDIKKMIQNISMVVQKQDLSKAIDQLILDIQKGIKYIKVYKQMKMYNDNTLNPILYNK